MIDRFSESVVESAALAWLEGLGWAIKHGPEIAPDELFAERASCTGVADENVPGRDALLPRLISGEIRVKDAEKAIESKL